ncbi:helix-turn-helix domain-containing protein [Larkinella soli]|uniref:helix-turn-helix domain-containing protein n=1 Tax=Larkinella soli TaxID=1770527 RepID=UPI000FFC60E5|nr:AraC family transcriptional regulator [Larkinella soli]
MNSALPLLLRVQESPSSSFHIRREQVPYFDNPWHYHPELELTLITESTGIRFVGDSIEPFGPGDLVLLGPNLPHFWRNDDAYYHPESERRAEALILRFRMTVWGSGFLDNPEMQPLRQLFQAADHGLHFPKEVADRIRPRMEDLPAESGIGRAVAWLRLFQALIETGSYRTLSRRTFFGQQPARDSDRMNRILAYIHKHLTDPISLDAVAAEASMNPAAFCRYFRRQTNKTFVDVLSELRINFACRLLTDTQKDVGQVCFESGFRNISHFNQVFRTCMGLTPTEFRRRRTASD